VVEIAERLAQETGETAEEVWKRTGENFYRLFSKADVP
jgi:Tat protein secretion system quality control protein TatD with DNase activity